MRFLLQSLLKDDSVLRRRRALAVQYPHHDELGRRTRCDAYLRDGLPGLAKLGRVGLGVALDVESLLRRQPHERARGPQAPQVRAQLALYANPQARLVRLVARPGHVQVHPSADGQEEAAYVDVAPRLVARERARAPHAYASSGEGAQAVDALRVERVLHRGRDVRLQVEDAEQLLVGWRLVHADVSVRARVDARDVTARRHQATLARLKPRIVERPADGLLRLKREPLALPQNVLGGAAPHRVEDGEPPQILSAVSERVGLHGEYRRDVRHGVDGVLARVAGREPEGHRVGHGD